jgi:Flp pilus assembly protein TadD
MACRAFIKHLAHGERLRREGRLAEATEELLAAVRLRPDHAGALFELGRLYFKQWRDDEAKFYLSLVVKKAPNHLEAHRLLGITCFQLEDWRGAEKYLGRATRLSQEEVPEIWALLAMVSWQRGKLNQAYRRCEKALELDTASALPYIVKGLVLAEIEDVQAAKVAIS